MTSREVALAPVTTASALGRWLADRIIPVIHSFRGRHLFVISGVDHGRSRDGGRGRASLT